MKEEDALEFFERVTGGTDRYETIDLEHQSGATLSGVEMHPVDKGVLADTMSALPDEMFDAVEEADDANEAEETIEEDTELTMNAISRDVVEAFENIVGESLRHPDLAPPQMRSVAEELSFEMLFNLGVQIMEMSMERDGAIQDFHERG